jgi:hypothetical protein
MDNNSPGGQNTAESPAPHAAADGHPRLFLVECRLPGLAVQDLVLMQATMIKASGRFAARGEYVRYLHSTFIPRQQRLLSLFEAATMELVRAASEAALIPFTSVEPALELADPGEPVPG